ncbi:MAG: Co2+/Mg2+ efflux protein ApaG [Phycisphaerales bacterium]|nr:Co2+/Mg2+ efflux protein ApaG [Phycisphaerales bacterium]
MAAPARAQSDLGSEAVTNGIRITVEPKYLPDYSEIGSRRYIYGYRVRIVNECDDAVRLTRRHWIIVNGEGERHDVEGEGVIGQQPLIEPGHVYEYSSFCPLSTRWGTMEGAYTFQQSDGREFDCEIARFYLVADGESE